MATLQKSSLKSKIIFIVGPTGTGKTQVGLALAGLLPCEFISADSMQLYRGMDIITDKLPLKLRRKYPHHLVDILAPTKEYSVAEFVSGAKAAINKVIKKKKTPVVIGGTGLYVNSLLYGIFEVDSKSQKVRETLQAQAQKNGIGFLYERLKNIDAQAALKIGCNDVRRIIRALEVYELTNKPISVLQKQRRGVVEDHNVLFFSLRRDRADLYSRIDQRVDFMVNAGLLDEVRGLLKKKLSRTAYMCIGVREMDGFLKGQYDLKEAVRLIKRNTRRYAKRQMTWFNKNKDIEWIDMAENADLQGVAEKIYERS
jgi:tRNA dimethylallyltransferase